MLLWQLWISSFLVPTLLQTRKRRYCLRWRVTLVLHSCLSLGNLHSLTGTCNQTDPLLSSLWPVSAALKILMFNCDQWRCVCQVSNQNNTWHQITSLPLILPNFDWFVNNETDQSGSKHQNTEMYICVCVLCFMSVHHIYADINISIDLFLCIMHVCFSHILFPCPD